MPANKKAKLTKSDSNSNSNNNNSPSWLDLAVREIDTATKVVDLKKIQTQLAHLSEQVEEKIAQIKEGSGDFSDNCMVKMVDSNHSQDQDLDKNMCGREVHAEFVAGPRAAPFSIDIDVKDFEGDTFIQINSDLFDMEKNTEDDEPSFEAPSDQDMDDFLTKAGLYHARTRLTTGDSSMDAKLCRRFAYAEVINEAIELIGDKYGYEDDCGVALGIGNEEIYGHLGLPY